MAAVDVRVRRLRVEVAPAGMIAVEAGATATCDAAIHLVGEKGPEVLVAVRAFGEAVVPPYVAGFHRPVLQVAFAAFLAYWTVVRMIDHQPFDHAGTEGHRIGVADADTQAVRCRGHAGHDEAVMLVVLVAELLDGALPGGAHRPRRGMPAEVGHVETESEQGGSRLSPSCTWYSRPSTRMAVMRLVFGMDRPSRGCGARGPRGSTSVRSQAESPRRRVRAMSMSGAQETAVSLEPRAAMRRPAPVPSGDRRP